MSHDRFDGPDLTRRILAATSGSACARAESLMGEDVDPLDRALLEGHLGRCEPCRALAEALSWALPTLPQLAERDPGWAFTAAVLARTSRRPARGLMPSLERAYRWCADLWQRPRIALEAAWVGAVVAAIVIWSPIAPSGAADQAVAAVQTGGAVVPHLLREAGDLTETFATPASKIERELDAAVQGLRERASTVVARGHSLWRSVFGDEKTDRQ
jgi:hypothetical protein